MNGSLGNWLIFFGLCLLIAGIVAKLGIFGWFANLPGDFHVKREGFQFYFPLTSMIIISIVLSALFGILRRFF